MPDFLDKLNKKPKESQESSDFNFPKQESSTYQEGQKEQSFEQESSQESGQQKEHQEESRQGGHAFGSQNLDNEQNISAPEKDAQLKQVEGILSEGLEHAYANLNEEGKRTVKTEGEKTAKEISGLLEKGKNVAKKVLHLIRNWLHKIPGINKYFLEQESKIKTDKILALKKTKDSE